MTRKCRHCRAEIPPKAKADHWQRAGFCNLDHMAAHGLEKARQAQERKNAREARERRQKERERRRTLRERKEAIKPRRQWVKEAQEAFNAFIRERDRDEPCICCGRWPEPSDWKPGGVWDAGHYLSVGSHPELRFNEDNCHKQLKSCNGGAGKYTRKNWTVSQEYKVRLIEKIGLERVERLEGPNPAQKYTIDDLKAIKTHYQKLTRELKKESGHERAS